MRDRREYMEKRYKENRERILEQHREYRRRNKERIKQYNRGYYETNKEYLKEYRLNYMRKWLKTVDGRACNQRSKTKRRTKMREIVNTLTAQEWLNILEKHNFKCAYCGCQFNEDNLPTRDHIIPISRGGNNTKENVIPACLSCNDKKGIKILNCKKKDKKEV